jgi:hypothetical protein
MIEILRLGALLFKIYSLDLKRVGRKIFISVQVPILFILTRLAGHVDPNTADPITYKQASYDSFSDF